MRCERAQTRNSTATRDQQHRRLDEREDAERRHVGLHDLAALEERLLVPGQHERERQRERRRARRAAAPSGGRNVAPRSAHRIGMSSTSRLGARRALEALDRVVEHRADARSAARAARRRAGGRARAGARRAAASTQREQRVEVRERGRGGGRAAAPAVGRDRAAAALRGLLGARRAPRARAARPPRRPRGRAQPCSNPTISEPSSSVADVGL